MATLVATLIAAMPRERAGSRTSSRYQYQANFSLLELIELHQKGTDYRAIFDYFDDLMIVNSSDAPTSGATYQIKGKDGGTWTTHAITKLGDADPPKSIVGKMYYNLDRLGSSITKAAFVSNAPFKMTLKDGSTSTPDHVEIRCDDLCDDDKGKISAALDADFPTPRDYDHTACFEFRRTNLHTSGYEQSVKGRLVELFETYGENTPVTGVYQTLIAAIIERSSDHNIYNSVDDLFLNKSLSRSEIQDVLDAAATKSVNILDYWQTVEAELTGLGRKPLEIIRLKRYCTEYIRARLRGDKGPTLFSEAAMDAATSAKQEIGSASSLSEIADVLRPTLTAQTLTIEGLSFEAALIVEAFEVWNEQ